jgi:hypothetical protein
MHFIKDHKNHKLIVLILKDNFINDIVSIISDYVRVLVTYHVLKGYASNVINITIENNIFFIAHYHRPLLGFMNVADENFSYDCFDISHNLFLHQIYENFFVDFMNFFLKCNGEDPIQGFISRFADDHYNYVCIKRHVVIKNLMRNDCCPQQINEQNIDFYIIKNTDLIKIIKKKRGCKFFLREYKYAKAEQKSMCYEIEKQSILIIINNNEFLDFLENLKIYLKLKKY